MIQTGKRGIHSDVSMMMRTMVAKPVSLSYSGTGQAYRGKQRKNFSITNVYLCIRGKELGNILLITIES